MKKSEAISKVKKFVHAKNPDETPAKYYGSAN